MRASTVKPHCTIIMLILCLLHQFGATTDLFRSIFPYGTMPSPRIALAWFMLR